jgi:hypothetical protein
MIKPLCLTPRNESVLKEPSAEHGTTRPLFV